MLFRHCLLKISPKEDDGVMIGANLKFSESSQDEIYRNGSGNVIQLPPELYQIGVNLSLNSL